MQRKSLRSPHMQRRRVEPGRIQRPFRPNLPSEPIREIMYRQDAGRAGPSIDNAIIEPTIA